MDNGIAHQGWLAKRGHLVSNWKLRWCILEKSIDSNCWQLSYFASAGSDLKGIEHKGTVELLSAHLDSSGRRFTITEGIGGKKTYPFRCKLDEKETSRWLLKIRSAINDSNKTHAAYSSLSPHSHASVPLASSVHANSSRAFGALPFRQTNATKKYVPLHIKDFVPRRTSKSATPKQRFRDAVRLVIKLRMLAVRLSSRDIEELIDAMGILKVLTRGPMMSGALYDFQVDVPLTLIMGLSEDSRRSTIVDSLEILSRLLWADFRFAERLLDQNSDAVDAIIRGLVRSVKLDLRKAATDFVLTVWHVFAAHLRENLLFQTIYMEILAKTFQSSKSVGSLSTEDASEMQLGETFHLRSITTIENLTSDCAFSDALVRAYESGRSPSESRLIPALVHIATASADVCIKSASLSAARNIACAYAISPLVREEVNAATARYLRNALMSLLENTHDLLAAAMSSEQTSLIKHAEVLMLEENLVELLWHLGTTQHRTRYKKQKRIINTNHQVSNVSPSDRYSNFME